MHHILRCPFYAELKTFGIAFTESADGHFRIDLRKLQGKIENHSSLSYIADLHNTGASLHVTGARHVFQLFEIDFQPQPLRHSHASLHQEKEWN